MYRAGINYIFLFGIAKARPDQHRSVAIRSDSDLSAYSAMSSAFAWFYAVSRIPAVAAKVLAEGPERHAGKNYYLSTDVLNGTEVAGVLGRATDRPIEALVMTPDNLALGVASGQVVMPGNIEANYAASMLEWARQTFDGRMAYSAVTTDTVATLLGRPPIKLEDWARQHRSDIGA